MTSGGFLGCVISSLWSRIVIWVEKFLVCDVLVRRVLRRFEEFEYKSLRSLLAKLLFAGMIRMYKFGSIPR